MNPIKIKRNRQVTNNKDPFYQSKEWKRLRRAKLDNSLFCEECERKGIVTMAEMVDHVVPISQGGSRTDFNNLQSLCNHCHAVKRANESNQSRAINPHDDYAS